VQARPGIAGRARGTVFFGRVILVYGAKSAVRPGDFNMWGEAGIAGRAFRSNRKSTSNVMFRFKVCKLSARCENLMGEFETLGGA
jgi:hypothetical protein